MLGDKVYVDGGAVSSSSSGGVQFQYSNSLVYIDLSSDFTPETATVSSIAKPAGPPNYWLGGVWVDDGLLYTGFSGRHPPEGDQAPSDQGLWSFRPTGDGTGGTWTNHNDTADDYFTASPRPFIGSVASGNGTGFYLGGQVDYNGSSTSANDTYQPVSGLVTYDFATQKVSNTTVTGISMDGFSSQGQMLYVPNFGAAGVVVSAGGQHKNPADTSMQSFSTVQILDAATGTWYEQATTGSAPQNRKEFCMAGAASSNDTYEVVVYAGWNDNLGVNSIPWDDLYVLSLPSFHWFQASYGALHPRHGLTCEHVGGGQILAVGGVDTTQDDIDNSFEGCFRTTDDHPQGLAVFDLGSMSFTNSYQRNKTVYDQSSAVRSYYEGGGGMADFTSSALKQVFSVQNFTAAATTTADQDTSSSSASASASGSASGAGGSSSSSSAGAIAGGVVGGVVLVGIVVGAVFYMLRRRGRKQQAAEKVVQVAGMNPGTRMDHEAGPDAYALEASKMPHGELQGQNMDYHRLELPDSTLHEADTRPHHPRFELP